MIGPHAGLKHIYLSGPMTGLPEGNYPAFFRYEEFLLSLGWQVSNPARINPHPPGKDVDEQTRAQSIWRDLEAVRDSDCMAVMPGWENSIGARAEMFLARSLNHPIFDIETGEEIIVK